MAFAAELQTVTGRLAAAGFLAAAEEAVELLAFAAGDAALLESAVERRLTGEPLAWITGATLFCGQWVRVDPGVYVPRRQSEPLALRAAELLPEDGVAIDLCTGSGAIAAVLGTRVPGARVVATELDERAVACARSNGVEAYAGDLFAPLPPDVAGRADVVVGVVPYVPTPDLGLLQRDTFTFETSLAYDGGPDGLAILRRAVAESAGVLRRGGVLLLELGGSEADALRSDLAESGFADVVVHRDEEGDIRAIEATYA